MSYIGVRQATLIPIFLSFITNLICTWLSLKSKHTPTINKIRFLHKIIIPFGFAGLLGCNLIQGGIFPPVVAWLIFVLILTIHIAEFMEIKEGLRRLLLGGYYFLLTALMMGIIVVYCRF